MNKALFTSQRQNWKTPRAFYQALDAEFHFDFDPCPDTPKSWDDNGLAKEWGTSTFCNPPFAEIGRWVAKAFAEHKKGKTVVLLIPSRTDTKWWHAYCMKASEIRFVQGRLNFDDGVGRAPFPSAIVIFRDMN